MIQLQLWTDADQRVPVGCPHCGHRFDVAPQLRERQAAVLDDPRVRALPGPSREFLIAALPILVATPEPIGPRILASELPYSLTATQYQIKKLVQYGIMRSRLIRRGGTYCRYELAIS